MPPSRSDPFNRILLEAWTNRARTALSSRYESPEIVPDSLDSFMVEAAKIIRPTFESSMKPPVRWILTQIHSTPFDSRLNAAKLRQLCGTRDHNVSTDFKRLVGCSIVNYLPMLRLSVSVISLELTDFTVSDVSKSAGFSSIQRFYFSYRLAFGRPPATDARVRRKMNSNRILCGDQLIGHSGFRSNSFLQHYSDNVQDI